MIEVATTSEVLTSAASAQDERIYYDPVSVVFLCFFSIQGVLGNLLVIFAVVTDKKLRSYTDAVVVNVAIFDTIVTGVILPTCIPPLLDGRDIDYYTGVFCVTIGYISPSTCIGSLMSLTFVALNKFVYICYNHLYNKIFTRVTVGVIIAGTWFYGFLVMLPSILNVGFGDIWYNPSVANCVPDTSKSLGFMIYFAICGLGVPMGLTFFSYGRIFWKLFKSRQNIGAASGKSSGSQKKYLQVYTMFAVSAVFVLSWCPYAIVCFWYLFAPPPFLFSRAATWMGFINSCTNCIVLAVVNKNYKAAYINFLTRCCPRKVKKVGATASVTVATRVD